jgi:hypothetical protein
MSSRFRNLSMTTAFRKTLMPIAPRLVNNDLGAWSEILRGSAEVPGVGTALLLYLVRMSRARSGLGSNQ